MSAKILVVDDKPTNLLLLENKLANEMYSVITVNNSADAIKVAMEKQPDVVLLDVIMPGMDGIEVCEAFKKTSEISHIPILLLSALDAKEDRVTGLEVGADDFLTIPINDIVLFARLKTLVRIKMLLDELRMRSETAAKLLGRKPPAPSQAINVTHANILLVEDDYGQAEQLKRSLEDKYAVTIASGLDTTQEALAMHGPFDLMIINSYLRNTDGINLASFIKGKEETRHLPVIMTVNEKNSQAMLRALQLGINDFLLTPIDPNEMLARVQTQIRRKRYKESLRNSYHTKDSETLRDGVSGVFGRAYFNEHLKAEVDYSQRSDKPLSLIMADVAQFKKVNIALGAAGGDMVLKELAHRMMDATRTADIVMRYEDDCFAILLPNTDNLAARIVAERIRKNNQVISLNISKKFASVETPLNIGVATMDSGSGSLSADSLLKLALQNLSAEK